MSNDIAFMCVLFLAVWDLLTTHNSVNGQQRGIYSYREEFQKQIIKELMVHQYELKTGASNLYKIKRDSGLEVSETDKVISYSANMIIGETNCTRIEFACQATGEYGEIQSDLFPEDTAYRRSTSVFPIQSCWRTPIKYVDRRACTFTGKITKECQIGLTVCKISTRRRFRENCQDI